MRIIRFRRSGSIILAAITNDDQIYPLDVPDLMQLVHLTSKQNTTVLELVHKLIEAVNLFLRKSVSLSSRSRSLTNANFSL